MHFKQKQIYFGKYSAQELASKYGTPVYVYDKNKILFNYRKAVKTARKYYQNFDFFYAIKACNNLAISKILVDEGAGIDAASTNEVRLAKALGLSGQRIIFSGNFLSDDDLHEGLRSGAIINLDDKSLFPRLIRFGKPDVICFRINPGYGQSQFGHFLTNAGPDAKFGLHPRDVVDAYRTAKEAGIKRFGAHMMPGSCMLEPNYFHTITQKLMQIIVKVVKEVNINFEFIDLGGGLGIPYLAEAKALDLDAVFEGMVRIVQDLCSRAKMPLPRLIMEPARYFVGNAGYLIGRVHTIKQGYSTIVGSDISMNILARPVMYGAYHRILIDGKEDDPKEKMGLCGQVCENTDFWCKDRELPATIEEGDLVVVADVGAYGYTMSYEYNGRLRPAEVLVDGDGHSLIRRRETFHDMVEKMILPEDIVDRMRSQLE